MLLLVGCHDFSADLDACLASGKCACPYETSSQPIGPCGNDRDLYLAATGDDANSGTDATKPRQSLSGVSLLPGDRIHLSGSYPQGLDVEGSGTAACPLTVDGTASFATSMDTPFHVAGSFVRLSGLHFEASGGSSSAGASLSLFPSSASGMMTDVLIENVSINTADTLSTQVYIQQCTRCTVQGSVFTGAALATNIVQTWSSEQTQLLNNKVDATVFAAAFDMRDHTSRIAFNDLKGVLAVRYEQTSGGDNLFERNIVHDVAGGPVVSGATRVLHNTFVNLGDATAADQGEFRGNIVSLAGLGLDGPAPDGGGYNLFNAAAAYAGGGAGATDVSAVPKLDATRFAPLDGSPAIDAADPNDPVPAGGGTRADIGAIERGAIVLPSGSYCVPGDAGTQP